MSGLYWYNIATDEREELTQERLDEIFMIMATNQQRRIARIVELEHRVAALEERIELTGAESLS